MNNRYSKSLQWLDRAEKTIPLGSQTFSKSKMSVPVGGAPLYIKHAKGCQITDIDDNTYTDFVNGLLCIGLGYQDPDVDAAIQSQLSSGISFSMPHTLEAEVAELLVDLIPCAEMVRFGKNGTDVTSAAIRIARAYTGREDIAVCGYHGWQDWYIGSTSRDLGVPKSTKALTHVFTYNDISSLEALFANKDAPLAAVIMEPMNIAPPENDFLHKVKALCEQNGTVLVFDEMITGFRFANGGAQQLFDVTPDLATFGKGLANGMPLSALVGKKELMMVMNDIFFSGTFGGETLSLAAAKACINKIKRLNVIDDIWAKGEFLKSEFNKLTSKGEMFDIKGYAPWTFLQINEGKNSSVNSIKSWIIQELSARGIMFIGTHNLSFAHTYDDISRLIACYDELFAQAVAIDDKEDIAQHLTSEPISAVFKVR